MSSEADGKAAGGVSAGGGHGNTDGGSGADYYDRLLRQQQNALVRQQQAIAAQAPEAVGSMGYAGSNIEKAWRPGVKQARAIYNEGLPALDPNGYLENTMAGLNASNPFANQLGSFNPNNPALQSLAGFDPRNQFIGRVGNFDATNQGISNFDPFMGDGTNPYADRLFNASAARISDQINSQFGKAGQGSSTGNLATQIQDLGDYAAKFYGGIYDADRNRALGAAQGQATAYQAQNALGLDALRSGMAGQQDQNRLGLDQIGLGIDAYGRQDDQRLQGLTSAMQGNQNQLSAAGSLLPGIQTQIQNQPYSNLQQYSNIVSQLTGSSPQQPKDPGSSGWDKLIGAGTIAAAAYLSDPRAKENIELVGMHKPTGLGVYHFNYLGSNRRFEGFMADEVERIYPEAIEVGEDGYRRVYYHMLDFEMTEIH